MTGSSVEMKGVSKIVDKRMTNKHAVENFRKTCTANGYYFAKAKSEIYKHVQLTKQELHLRKATAGIERSLGY